MRGHALVVGANGLVGRNLVEHMANSGEWDITTLSRSAGTAGGIRGVAADLMDPRSCRDAAGALADVTHVFYAARFVPGDEDEERRINADMLVNIVDALDGQAKGLEHICLIHGTKWYGSNVGPYKTPAEEDDPLPPVLNFYHIQQDFIRGRQVGRRWSWSALRPHIVCGLSMGYPSNLMSLIGVYGTLCREKGAPFTFPGTPESYNAVVQATDAGLLSRAAVWAATTEACANNAFNIINSDYFRWANVWAMLAEFFGLEDGGVATVRLAHTMKDADALWDKIVQRAGLTPLKLGSLANWAYADYLFSCGWDNMSSTVKARQYGFNEVVATGPMLLNVLEQLRRDRIIV
jgi:nucleoside-diphosphate-sugar epimerase